MGWWLGGGWKVRTQSVASSCPQTTESPGGVAEALLSCYGKETSCHLSGTSRFIAMNLISSPINFCFSPHTQPRLWSIILINKIARDTKI